MVLANGSLAAGQEGVLAGEGGGLVARRMLFDHLRAEADRHLARRREEVAGLATAEQVVARQRRLREWLRQSLGEFPEPGPAPVGRVTGELVGEGYRVQKVIYDSRPGLPVTAALYLPDGPGPFPGVLVPCGHSDAAKAYDAYQRICILLARNGFAVLCFDPLGQGERRQFPGRQWGSYPSLPEHMMIGTSALLVGRQAAGYMLWDAIRSLDYLAGRPEVDAARLGCTGISGGGLQTAYLMAVDDRLAAAAPGCYLTGFGRLLATFDGVGDAEQCITGQIAAGLDHADYLGLHAPKPTLILAATRDYFDIRGTRDCHAEAKRLFGLLGHPDHLAMAEHDLEHGFGQPLRESALAWMGRWLLGRDGMPGEAPTAVASRADLQCTASGNVLDEPGARNLMELIADEGVRLAAERQARRAALSPAAWLAEVRRLLALPVEVPAATVREVGRQEVDGLLRRRLIFATEPGILVPAVLLQGGPESREWPLALVVDGAGKEAALQAGGMGERLARQGFQVLAIDPRGLGETEPRARQNRELVELFGEDWHEALLSLMLDRPLLGQRVYDLLAVLEWAVAEGLATEAGVYLYGRGAAGPVALHAAALDGRFAALDLDRSLVSWQALVEARFHRRQLTNVVPGALRHYDLPELAAAIAPRPVEIHNPQPPGP